MRIISVAFRLWRAEPTMTVVTTTGGPSRRSAQKRSLDFHDVVLIESMHFDDGAWRVRPIAPELRLYLVDDGTEAEHVGSRTRPSALRRAATPPPIQR